MAQIGLEQQVKLRQMWPTPRATHCHSENQEAWEARNAKGDVATPPLGLAVKMWATPCAGDYRSPNTNPGSRGTANETGLMPSSEHALPAHAGGQLNPDWVEWLMGWPIGFTDLKPLVMGKFRLWLLSHGAPLQEV